MTETLLRFFIGGALIAALPFVNERMGPAVAGVFLLYPAVTFIGLLYLGRDEGLHAVANASLAATLGLPTVLAFLLSVHYCARSGLGLPIVLAVGIASWITVAVPIVLFTRGRMGI